MFEKLVYIVEKFLHTNKVAIHLSLIFFSVLFILIKINVNRLASLHASIYIQLNV